MRWLSFSRDGLETFGYVVGDAAAGEGVVDAGERSDFASLRTCCTRCDAEPCPRATSYVHGVPGNSPSRLLGRRSPDGRNCLRRAARYALIALEPTTAVSFQAQVTHTQCAKQTCWPS